MTVDYRLHDKIKQMRSELTQERITKRMNDFLNPSFTPRQNKPNQHILTPDEVETLGLIDDYQELDYEDALRRMDQDSDDDLNYQFSRFKNFRAVNYVLDGDEEEEEEDEWEEIEPHHNEDSD